MPFIEIFLIAFGLSMDSLAVSIAAGTCSCKRKIHYKNYLKIALFMGFFQAFMPLIGWLLGTSFAEQISSVDHWIAFALLFFIGGKMIYEGIWGKDNEKCIDFTNNKTLLILAIATSIDAFAIGIGFSAIQVTILPAVAIIGLTTFLLSMIAFLIGKKFGDILGSAASIIGGVILVALAIKALF